MEQLYWLKGYSRRLGRSLNCPLDQRQHFLAETRRMAEDFLQGNPKATPEEVQEYLGPPRKLAHTFLESLDPEELHSYQTRRKYIKRMAVGLVVAAFLVLISLTVFLWNRPLNVQTSETLVIYNTNMER